MQQQQPQGRELVWGEIHTYLQELARLPASKWQGGAWAALASVLGGLDELSKLYAPPLPADVCSSSDIVCCLAVLTRRVLSGDLQPLRDVAAQQLLDTTAHFLASVYDTEVSSGDAISRNALELAKHITVAGLCPVLADAVSQAAKKIRSMEKQQQLEPAQQQQDLKLDQIDAMHNGAALLRLALAVAALWPGGILRSSTARCLAGGSYTMSRRLCPLLHACHRDD
jgi:hypothetical protein